MSGTSERGRVHVVQILEAADGGTWTHLLQLLKGLDPARFKLTAIVSARRNPAIRDEYTPLRRRGVEIIEVPMARAIYPRHDSMALYYLTLILSELRPDVVHTHASKAGYVGRFAARFARGIPVIHTPHTFAFQGYRGCRRWFYRMLERYAAPLTARLVLLSEGQRSLVERELPALAGRAVVIENAVDGERFRPQGRRLEARAALGLPQDAPVVGTITRFVPQKGCDVFLQALARVMGQVAACRAVIVGDGAQRFELMRWAAHERIEDRILWLSHTDRPEEVYEALDLFVLSSRYEGMPYSLLEAMASGLPVLTTRISGCQEVVQEGVTGRLVPPDDPAAQAEGMIALLNDAPAARRMGEAGRRLALERFPLSRFIERVSALYEEEAKGPRSV